MYNLSLIHRCSGSQLISRQFPRQTHPAFSPRRITTATSSGQTRKPSPASVTRKWLFSLSIVLLSCGGAYLARNKASKKQVDSTVFHPFEVVSKQDVSSTCSIFTLRSHTSPYHKLYRDAWKKGAWSVQIKQPQLQIARSYTPLPPNTLNDEVGDHDPSSTELRFLIRREPHGEVSGYLHNLPVGAIVHVRGLDVEYEIPSDIDEVLFLAGGTGIAPALQVAHCLLERRKSTGFMPKLHFLWANRRREDAVDGVNSTRMADSSAARKSWTLTRFFWAAEQPTPREQQDQPQQEAYPPSHLASIIPEINRMKQDSQGHITLDYFIDEEGTYITQGLLKTYLSNPASQALTQTQTRTQARHQAQAQTPTRRRSGLIMISGPDGFVSHHAGPKVWADGGGGSGGASSSPSSSSGKQSQGNLGGNLKAIIDFEGDSHWDIWKL